MNSVRTGRARRRVTRLVMVVLAMVIAAACNRPAPVPGSRAVGPGSSDPGHAQTRIIYTCPMHPEVQDTKPGQCPKCGMDLVKKEITSGGAPAAPAPPSSAGPAAPGLEEVAADAGKAALAGIRTVAATTTTLAGTVRAVGTVMAPESGMRQITTKVAGWIQKLYVNTTGQDVRAGEPLFEFYSPELLASQEEYLHARQVAGQFAGSKLPEVQRGGADLAATARRRLELFDVPAEFIQRLEETGQPQRTVTFHAPFAGYVAEKVALEGQRVEAGMNVMTIGDLSHVWVIAQVYEAESRVAQPGRGARVTLPYNESVSLAGRVTFVYPMLDMESRTLKVRLDLPNPRLALKPGMFVNVTLDAERERGVVVPDSALIDTGTRQVVFVETSPGHYEPRDVKAGLRSEGQVVLRSGVKAGEQVVVAASFLLDSESRLRSMIRK
jgi:multidrug efflux pump subunit AcrA (membrane-fusion protein)